MEGGNKWMKYKVEVYSNNRNIKETIIEDKNHPRDAIVEVLQELDNRSKVTVFILNNNGTIWVYKAKKMEQKWKGKVHKGIEGSFTEEEVNNCFEESSSIRDTTKRKISNAYNSFGGNQK